jgi:hypothetical protein
MVNVLAGGCTQLEKPRLQSVDVVQFQVQKLRN